MMSQCPSSILIPGQIQWVNTYVLSKIWHTATLVAPPNAKDFLPHLKATLGKQQFNWDKMTVARNLGGLGLLDIKAQSLSLQVAQIWKPWLESMSVTQEPPTERIKPIWIDWFTDQFIQVFGPVVNVVSPNAKRKSAKVAPCHTLRRLLLATKAIPVSTIENPCPESIAYMPSLLNRWTAGMQRSGLTFGGGVNVISKLRNSAAQRTTGESYDPRDGLRP